MRDTDAYEIGDIVAAIYRSAYDSAEWPTAVERLRAIFHGSQACLARIGPNVGPDDAVAANADPAFQLRIPDFLDETMEYAGMIGGARDGLIYRDDDFFGRERFRGGRLWNDWMAPQDMYGGLAVKLMTREQSVWIFDVQRGRRQERFSTADQALFTYLAPHVTRAVEIARGIGTARTAGSVSESLTVGIVLVDGEFRILGVNPLAEAMLARPGSPLRRARGGLRASARAAPPLEQLVVDACRTRDGVAPGIGGDLVLRADTRIDGAVDLAVSVAPATPGPDPVGMMDRTCFVMIRELANALPAGLERLAREAFGLSAKEAQVAVGLAAGRSVTDIAAASGTSLNTVRTQLAAVFRKTRTKQQSELVALLKTVEPPGQRRTT